MSTEQNPARPTKKKKKKNQNKKISKTKEIVPKTIKSIIKKSP